MKKIAVFLCMTRVLLMGQPQGDLILFNRKIVTVDASFSIAQAMAIKQGTIIAVGTNAAVQATAGPTTRAASICEATAIRACRVGRQSSLPDVRRQAS